MLPESNRRVFYHLLGNNLLAGITHNTVWFAVTFWVYLETGSILATSWIAGMFAVFGIAGGIIFGPIVDHEKKKTALVQASIVPLLCYSLALLLYLSQPSETWHEPFSPVLWSFILLLMLGVTTNGLRNIATPTIVTNLFIEGRDKANGLVGATQGVMFTVTSVFSGILIGWFGMGVAITLAIIVTAITLAHLLTIHFPDTISSISKDEENKSTKLSDLKITIATIIAIPGLIGLIAFNTFNNLLGGVFMALMDPYGLSLVEVEIWGFMWGIASVASIAGGLIIGKVGIGKSPLRVIMLLNILSWGMCLIFPIQASVILLMIGMCTWMTLFPIIEAAEQTLMQNIVPADRQGRVFGLAQSVESLATPITTLLAGPIAYFYFIPFMTDGYGAATIGDWFGTGEARGMALMFISAGLIGLIITIIAWSSRSYRYLSNHHETA